MFKTKFLNFLTVGLIACATISLPLNADAYYNSRPHGGFSRPSSSFSKPSFSSAAPSSPSKNGFSKPSTPLTPSTTTSKSSGWFSKPGSSTATSNGGINTNSNKSSTSALAVASNKSISSSSLKEYQAERTNAIKPPQPINTATISNTPAYRTANSRWGGNTDNYFSQRTVVYNTYRTAHPQVFVITHNLSPNYGMYDSGFLTGMFLGYVGASITDNAYWLAAQQNQPWYSSYREDLNRQAVDNAELRAQLAIMDAKIAQINAQGGVNQNTTNSLPTGVDPALAIAPETIVATAPDVTQQNTGGSHWFLWTILVLGVTGTIIYLFVKKL